MKRKYSHKSEEISRGGKNLGKKSYNVHSSSHIKRETGAVAYGMYEE
jgi:hypothetical protein